MGVLLLVVGIGGLIGLGFYVGHQQQQKRTLALQEVAERLRWGFQERPGLEVIPGLERFELFTQGRNRQIRNFLAGQKDGLRAAIFDYSYVTGSGKSQTTWRQTVLYLRSEALALPDFSLRPENLFHRIGGLFGYQDIDLEEHPEFSRRYLLRGQDEVGIRAAFGPEVVAFFEAEPGACTAAAATEVFFWRSARMVAPDGVPALLQTGLDLLGRLQGQAPPGTGEGA